MDWENGLNMIIDGGTKIAKLWTMEGLGHQP